MELIKSNSKYASVQPPIMEASKINIKLLFQHKLILDKKGNLYNIEDNKLIKIGLKDFSSNLSTIIDKWKEYTIIFNIYNIEDFNKLSILLKDIPNRENNIIIDISNLTNLNKDDYLNFKDLPGYTYVTTHNLDYPSIDEKESPNNNVGALSFSNWILWLDDKDLGNVMDNLLPSCKRHILSERVIAKQFYAKYAVDSHLEENMAFEMFKWCSKNIVNSDTNDDSVLAYRTHKGSAIAKAKLLKLLLNNKYTKINCDIEYGYLNGQEHVWNTIKLNNKTYMVDTTNSKVFISKEEMIDNGYEPYIKNNSSLKRVIC